MIKRLGLWIWVLIAMTETALAATLCIDAPGVVALTDARGNELIENGRFEAGFTVREAQLYAFGRVGAYKLFDASGQVLGKTEFSMIEDTGDALVFRSDEHYGAMDDGGALLIPAKWSQLISNGAGGWLALEGDPLDGQPDEIIKIDADGTEKKTGVYCVEGLNPMSDGRMPYMDENGRYGAVDAGGDVAIEPAWDYVGLFSNGLAKVVGNDGMGMIDITGRVVIPAVYTWLDRSASMIAAWDGSMVDIFAPRGGQRRVRLSGKARELALVGEYLEVRYDGRVCLYNASGRLLIQDDASLEYAPGARGQLIASSGDWGEKSQWLVNPDGAKASGMYQQLLPLCAERYAFLSMSGEEYYSPKLQRTQVSWDYGSSRYGLMDARGRVLLSAKYREIRALDGDCLLLIGEDRVQIADRNGAVIKTWIIPEGEVSTRAPVE